MVVLHISIKQLPLFLPCLKHSKTTICLSRGCGHRSQTLDFGMVLVYYKLYDLFFDKLKINPMTFIADNITIKDELPLIPLKNVVLFPRVAIPLLVQRPKSAGSLDLAMSQDRLVVFVAQKNIYDDVDQKDLFRIGTVGRVFEVHKLPDGSSKINVEGIARVRIKEFSQVEPFFKVKIESVKAVASRGIGAEAIMRATIDQFRKLLEVRQAPAALGDLIDALNQVRDPEQAVYLITINLNLELKVQQDILETMDSAEGLKKISFYISRELEIIEAEKKVFKETKKQLGKMQKEIDRKSTR